MLYHFNISSFLAVLFLAHVCSANAHTQEEPDVWLFGLEEIEGSIQHVYAQEFKKRIEEKTDRKVIVDIYAYGLLGESEDLTALTELGTLQLTHASMGIIGERFPIMQVFNLPYLLSKDDERNQKVLSETSAIYDVIGNSLINNNLRLLTLYLEGDMVWSTNAPIRRPSDFEGFKMRVMNSPLVAEIFEQYGAEAVTLPYSRVYGALQSELVDGQSNPIFAIEEMKFYEVTDYLIWSGQRKFVTSVLANQPWYLSLDAKTKQILRETIQEMTPFIFKQQKAMNDSRLETIKTYKPDIELLRLSASQQGAFKRVSELVKKRYVEQTGSQGGRLLDALNAALSNQ